MSYKVVQWDAPNRLFFVTCARGLEDVLADELRNLSANDVQPGRGGVHFRGDAILLYQANLWLRTAVRILFPILEAPVTSPEELYDAVRTLSWSDIMTPEHTLAIDCNVRDSNITHSHYAALKAKDAICDWFVDEVGRRPSVDVQAPMMPLNLHIYKNQAVLSLDSSGQSLHKRGYREALHKAALNEALAAALIQLTGWDGSIPFVDPLCGSGTLPIEAAWLALDRPPGLTRKRFAFQSWPDFDIRLWTVVRDQTRDLVKRQLSAPIVGSDQRGDVLRLAEANARSAGIGQHVRFERCDLRDSKPPTETPGILLCNPPYGERIGEEKDLIALYRQLGEVWRDRYSGWKLFVFSGNKRLLREVDSKPVRTISLFNGRIPCQLVEFGDG